MGFDSYLKVWMVNFRCFLRSKIIGLSLLDKGGGVADTKGVAVAFVYLHFVP